MEKSNSKNKFPRRIKSFVLREGRFTEAQQRAFEQHWEAFGLDYSDSQISLIELFGREAPTILEIGFGNGDSLAQMAEQNPHLNYLGIEVHRPGAGQLLKQIEKKSLSNVRISTHDAVEVLKQQLPENSLGGAQIFFPDPWPKKRHHKRRIIQTDFMTLLATRLANNGFAHLATDWAPYAEHMLDVMQSHPNFKNTVNDYVPRPDTRPMTKFEQRGLKLGHDIFDLVFTKK